MCYRYLAGTAKCLSGCVLRGCGFHWSQAMWRKVQDLGLRTAYIEHSAVYKFIRRVLAILFLSAEHITPAIHEMCKLTTHTQLIQLLDYVEATWLSSACGM